MTVTLADVRAAAERIRGAVYRSPCPYSLNLSRLTGARIFCKLDHLQMTGSFKERGALNRLLRLPEDQRRRGVIAASAGNHALGLAWHGSRLGIPVTVVMPQRAPLVKVTNCRSFGAEVIQRGEYLDEARVHADQLAAERGLTYIHGFDDPDVIAGQGTIGLEILEDVPDVDDVIVPVGGGGLIAGIGTVIKALKPLVRVIGAESAAAPTLHASLLAGQPVRIAPKPTLADGLAVAQAGALCVEIARRVVDQVVLVDEPAIATAVVRLLELEKSVVEGAGAVPLAAVLSGAVPVAGRTVVLVLAGGNIDLTVLGRVIDRGLAADGRLCRVTVHISDRPGSLARLLTVIGEAGASVDEVFHDRHFGAQDVAQVTVTVVMETRDQAHVEMVKAALGVAGYQVR